jgi:hypothetical protein
MNMLIETRNENISLDWFRPSRPKPSGYEKEPRSPKSNGAQTQLIFDVLGLTQHRSVNRKTMRRLFHFGDGIGCTLRSRR